MIITGIQKWLTSIKLYLTLIHQGKIMFKVA